MALSPRCILGRGIFHLFGVSQPFFIGPLTRSAVSAFLEIEGAQLHK